MTQTFDVVSSRQLAAPVGDVWTAWTTSAGLREWWGPREFTCPVADLDVRPGGVSLVAMQAPAHYGGGRTYNTWSYAVVEPAARLEYVMRFADDAGTTISPADAGIPPGVPGEVPHVVTFAATTDGGTQLTVTETGYATSDARDLSKAGLEQCLDKLAEALAERRRAAAG